MADLEKLLTNPRVSDYVKFYSFVPICGKLLELYSYAIKDDIITRLDHIEDYGILINVVTLDVYFCVPHESVKCKSVNALLVDIMRFVNVDDSITYVKFVVEPIIHRVKVRTYYYTQNKRLAKSVTLSELLNFTEAKKYIGLAKKFYLFC